MHSLASAAVVALLAAGCTSGSSSELDPTDVALYALVTTIDGTSFYPPLGPEPTPRWTFDPTLVGALEVVLETTDAGGRASTLGRFSASTEPRLVYLDRHDLYFVNVPAAAYFTDPALAYRFRVLMSGREIARSDMSSKIFEVMRYVPAVPVGVKLRIERRPAPLVATIAPAHANRGSGDLTITLAGSNFMSDSVVRFGGRDAATTKVSDTQLTATIPSAWLAPGLTDVAVFTPAPGGGNSANLVFQVEDGVGSAALVAGGGAMSSANYSVVASMGGTSPVRASSTHYGYQGGLVGSTGGGALSTTFSAGCSNGIYPSCKALFAAGCSAGDGTYTVDFDGPGGLAPVQVHCDMTNGGFTYGLSDTAAIAAGYYTLNYSDNGGTPMACPNNVVKVYPVAAVQSTNCRPHTWSASEISCLVGRYAAATVPLTMHYYGDGTCVNIGDPCYGTLKHHYLEYRCY